jgi:hypothetical protein
LTFPANLVTGWVLPHLLTRKFSVVVPGLAPKQYAMDGCSSEIHENSQSTDPVMGSEMSLYAGCWNSGRSVLRWCSESMTAKN